MRAATSTDHQSPDNQESSGFRFRENIQAIVDLEQEALSRRSIIDKAGDSIGTFAGSPTFVILHIFLFSGWIIWNLGLFGNEPFDPYPFTFLTMVVSLEAIFLSAFVLMSQNRMSRQADHRAELTLQIDMLAEQEMTKVLEMLQQICVRVGLEQYKNDKDVNELLQQTHVETLAKDLEEQLPDK